MDKPRRDGIAEILRSGRAPGFVVRGSESKTFTVEVSPHVEGERDLRRRKQIHDRLWNEKRKVAEKKAVAARMSRKRDGAIRHVGSVPLEDWVSLKRRYGDDLRGDNTDKILDEHGYLWDRKKPKKKT